LKERDAPIYHHLHELQDTGNEEDGGEDPDSKKKRDEQLSGDVPVDDPHA